MKKPVESLFHFLAPPGKCSYLPEQTWRLEYEVVAELSAADYSERLAAGWRRFGDTLFRPRCPVCKACQSLRVLVDRFRPDRSQRRVRKINEGAVRLQIGTPSLTAQKLDLYDRYHAYQADAKDWPEHGSRDAASYRNSFTANPLPTEEWCYFVGDRLVGVGYVDALPVGFSAIYFFYDPDYRQRSLGIWNVLTVIAQAAARRLPHAYLGYYVAGCRSMEYKMRFRPNEVIGPDGRWHPSSSIPGID